MKFSKLIVAAAISAALSPALMSGSAMAQAAAPAAVTPSGDIFATLTASGQFTTLLKAVDATNLTAVLKSAGPLTIFAPTDAAFAALPAGQLDTLMNAKPPADLQKLILLHIVNAKVDETKIKGAKGPVPSTAGTQLYLDGSTTPFKVDDATVSQTVPVANGVIYVIDKVLSPTFTPPPAEAK